jgi:hypothetical protein
VCGTHFSFFRIFALCGSENRGVIDRVSGA